MCESLFCIISNFEKMKKFLKLDKQKLICKIVHFLYSYFPHFRYCMYVPIANSCRPFTDKVSSLRSLLAFSLHKCLVWSVGILIIVLNFIVLFLRTYDRKREHVILKTFVKFLSASDSLIGFYLLAIGYFDLKFGDKYHQVALDFVHSWQCTSLGALAVFSKQFSLFIVLLISFNRNRAVTIQNFYFRSTYHIILVTVGFFLSLFIALFPIVFWSPSNKNNIYFAANMLCYPLHLAEPFLLGWQFNAAVNIFINLPIVSAIIFLYAHMYFIIKENRKTARPATNLNSSKTNVSTIQEQPLNSSTNLISYSDHTVKTVTPNSNLIAPKNNTASTISEDHSLAIRLSFIVATDCICWLPIIFIKIVALFNVEIPGIFRINFINLTIQIIFIAKV